MFPLSRLNTEKEEEMHALTRASASIQFDSDSFSVQNVVGVYLGQEHTYNSVGDLAKWAWKANGWELRADEVTKKVVDAWLRDPDNDCLRARGDSRWQTVSSLQNRIEGEEEGG